MGIYTEVIHCYHLMDWLKHQLEISKNIPDLKDQFGSYFLEWVPSGAEWVDKHIYFKFINIKRVNLLQCSFFRKVT